MRRGRGRSLTAGGHVVWQVLVRCCRPTVDRFMALILFSLAGTLMMVLWTYEPPSSRRSDHEDEDVQRQLVEQLIRNNQQQKQVNRLDTGSNDHHPHLGDSHQQRNNHRIHASSPKRRPAYRIGNNDDKLPEIVLETTVKTQTPKQVVMRASANRTGRQGVGNDRTFSAANNSSGGDDFLRKVRLKLLRVDVTSAAGPEVDRRRSELVPGVNNSRRRRWCSVYNTTADVGDDLKSLDCKRLLVKPLTTVCLYSDADDIHVSRHIREDGLWEPHIVRLYQNLLFQNPDLGVIDIGAHIGQYSLLAASMRRPVVAVEPYPPSLRRLQTAIKINNVDQQILVVDNAVSDVRGTFQIGVPPDNQGGAYVQREPGDIARCDRDSRCPSNVTTIRMDDLLEVVTFSRAVMKIDIEGHERRAFYHADRLFDSIRVDYIFMEWIKLRAFYGAEVDDTEDKRLVQRLVDWLTRRGYSAHSLVLFQRLNPDYWYGWPEDIFWQHRDADPFL